MRGWWRDLTFAVRTVRRRPRSAAMVIGILALGIGATTAVYSVVDGVMVRSLPYPDADRLVTVGVTFPGREWRDDVAGLQHLAGVAYPSFADVRDRSRSLDRLVGVHRLGALLPDRGQGPELVDMMGVTDGFFEALSVTPLLGRTFLPDDYAGRNGDVAILTHSTWRDRFGADPAVVGSGSSTLAASYTIVGVLPPDFAPPEAVIAEGVEFWIPLDLAHPRYESRDARSLSAFGRLAPDATLDGARAELDDLAASIALEHPEGAIYPDGSRLGWGANPLHAATVGASGRTLLVFLGAAGLLLLIAVLNAANLLLVRGFERADDVGVRMALGANRGAMIRQLVVESLLFSTLAGLLGIALGWAAVAGFRGLSPDIPRIDSVQVDLRILAITLTLSTLVGLAAGLVPAFRTGTDSLAAGLRRSASHVAGRGRRWMDAMVAGQLALALILGVGATLLVRSYLELRAVDPGFAPEGLTTFSMGTKRSAEPEFHWQAWDALLAEVRRVPGLTGVAAASNLPFESPNWAPGVSLPGAAPDEVMTGNAGYLVTPGYLETMGIPIVRGRGFTAADGAEDSPVILLNEAFVRQHLDGADALGMSLALGEDGLLAEVVGIVGDVVQTRAEEGLRPAVYVPYRQGESWPWARIVVRSDRDPVQLAADLREAGSRYASFLPVQNFGTLSQRILGTRAEPRLHTLLLLGFAAVAGLLAAAGVYGTLAYTVGRRRREMGIRMAMGADAARIFGIVLRQSVGVALGGLTLGLIGAALLGRALERFLFQVEPLDLTAFAGASILLMGAALLAGILPARRATRVDPTVSLRSE